MTSRRRQDKPWAREVPARDKVTDAGSSRSQRAGQVCSLKLLMSALLIFLGISLLVFGSLAALPYVRSRLWNWPAVSGQEVQRLPVENLGQVDTPTLDTAASTVGAEEQYLCEEAREDAGAFVESTPAEPLVPTRLQIGRLGLDAPVVPVGWSMERVSGRDVRVWDVPDRGSVGWHQGSAPLGEVGNTVLNGHNTTGGEVFRNLYTLVAGDRLTVSSGLQSHTYVVSSTLVLPEAGRSWEERMRNASLLEPTPDERVTLVTCHPYGSLRNRLIVVAVPAAAESIDLAPGGE